MAAELDNLGKVGGTGEPHMNVESDNSSILGDEYWDIALQDKKLTQYDATEITIVTVIMPCILVVGLVTNSTFLFVIHRVTWMRTNVNTYLLNLAVADILVLSLGVGDKLWHYMKTPFLSDETFRGVAGCVLSGLLVDSVYFTGLFLITLVSVHRFNAVCRPHSGSHQQTKASTRRWIAGAWLGGILLAGILIPSYCKLVLYDLPTWPDTPKYNRLPQVIGFCQPVRTWMIMAANLVQTVPFFVVMTVNTFLYIRIIMSLNHIVAKGSEFGCKDVNERIRNRVTKMLVANGCVFFMCLFPFELASILSFAGGVDIGAAWIHGFQMLLYINSTVNPIIYGITNSKYRKAYVLAYTCYKQKSRDMVKYELSIPLNRMKDRPATDVTDCRVRGGDS
ncbi:somatostatin receptor type 5-like [Patiria miniata]|uniref:G-protein coupled receptors family 1 profile domain-containing protein n=1 Tax=Patiria miniata TaxID=46514 RepID=A0A914AIP3_PATMI|nr:somatostatin receptor type 5-like [Patiria miniata]